MAMNKDNRLMQAYIPPPPRDREALCVQLNAAIGDFRQDAVSLKLFGSSTDVREQKGAVQAEAGDRPLFYSWLGDALLRFEFVVAGNELPALVRPSDLKRLDLEPRAALVQAVQNARARWGSVKPKAGSGGVWQLEGENPRYLAWTWFVPSLWASLAKAMKAPLLVAMPRRGEVLFAPANKAAAVAALHEQAAAAFSTERVAGLRVSSYSYLFDGKEWRVHQSLSALRNKKS